MFDTHKSLKIGATVEINGPSLRIEISDEISDLQQSHNGRVYAVGCIGSFIRINLGRTILFAIVRMLRMRSDIEREDGHAIQPSDDARIIEADLFAQGTWRGGKLHFERGVNQYPLPQQSCYLMTNAEVDMLFRSAESAKDATSESRLCSIGTYSASKGTVCRADLNKMLSQHMTILGSTGSGKSCATAAVLHSILALKDKDKNPLKPNIIIIDPHGEYAKAFGDQAKVYRAYESDEPGSNTIQLPYWLMDVNEFRSLVIGKTEHEATSQNNIVHKALMHARLHFCGITESASDPGTTTITIAQGNLPGDPRIKSGVDHEVIASFDCDSPIEFEFEEFVKHIQWEQSSRINGSVLAPLPPSDSFRKKASSVLSKCSVLRNDSRIRFLMHPNKGITLKNVMKQFFDASHPIKIIDISGTPGDVADSIIGCVGRLLYQYKVNQSLAQKQSDPVLVVCEEAHRYLPNSGKAEHRQAQHSIRTIAKEGRKYGLSLLAVSQRPSDVEPTVLSQCGTWIILRLTNGADQAHVGSLLPDTLSGLTKILPSLGRAEALFVGEAAAIPSRIKINDLPKEKRPESSDMDFYQGWCSGGIAEAEMDALIERWQNKPVAPESTNESDDIPF